MAMQSANRLQATLKKGKTSFGSWQMLPGTNLARQLARSGVDWICVDTEHGNIDDSQMHEAVTAIAATQVSPIVRVAAAEPWMVKRALDSGAHGIMVPLLENAEQVKRLVSSAKFPPLGTRGFGSPFPQGSFSSDGQATPNSIEYLRQANDSLITIIQIETKEALANIDDIAAIPGVDILFVGPFDLGNNIGHPLVGEMHEELKAAIAKIRTAAETHGKWSGIFCSNGQQARVFADQGFKMISINTDVASLQVHTAEQLTAAKGSLAHSAYNVAKGAAAKMTGPYGKSGLLSNTI